jgi:hypothetical protein
MHGGGFANSLARIRTEVSPIMSRTLYPLSYQAAKAGYRGR